MKFLNRLLILFIFTALPAITPTYGQSCAEVFQAEFANKESFVHFSSGREMNLLVEPAKPDKETFLIIHGLGMDLHSLDGIAQGLQAKGFGTIQMDLHGHGKTLTKYMEHSRLVPDKIPYENQVEDLAELIRESNLKNVHIIGHSYGGGIAIALAKKFSNTSVIKSIHLMAPYLQALDRYYQSFNPAFVYWKWMVGQKGIDFTLDPLTKANMETILTRFYKDRDYPNNASIPLDKLKQLNIQVEAAIAVTMGIREFNPLKSDLDISRSTSIQLFAAENDQLVPRAMINQFANKLKADQRSDEVIAVPGDHFFPLKAGAELVRRILLSEKPH